MGQQLAKTTYRKDYTAPAYLIERVELHFELGEDFTDVRAQLTVKQVDAAQPLVLAGRELELLALHCDGEVLATTRYQVDSDSLTIHDLPDTCTLALKTRIYPQLNTSLEGLYQSSGNFCTQCEAEGFRKITYMLDRPDVMAVYTTTLVADKQRYPVLLANGNLQQSGDLADGRHYATWHDPYKKPSYLFAIVAGDLRYVEDFFTTRSGREVTLCIYVESEHIDQCDHAMQSLKKSMAWDEQVFGLEYDLDIYMIVAVSDFNMGAMENKGLNIFNTKYVLAKQDTATDSDYTGVEAVIAHEYFHNWTGNRVTCRDWFQLSLKEGLTVFRDQEFSADRGSRGVKRIDDVRLLRSAQFAEDAGPMAHPVRPDEYMEINNFYTVTIYNKGAEVVRLQHTLLGAQGFRRGMDLYFQRHDGQAVTCDDFVAAMADANNVDLAQFKRWYSQAGTPELTVERDYDAATESYTLTIKQSCPATPGQATKQPFHIPVRMGLLDQQGNELALQLDGENAATGTTRVLELRQAEQQYQFINVAEPPVPSLLRGFSAPVKLHIDYSDDELMFLLAHDSDDFNRWEAGQQLAIRTLLKLVEQYQQNEAPTKEAVAAFCAAYRQALVSTKDQALLAQILTLPSETYLADQMAIADVDNIHAAREYLRQTLANSLQDELHEIYQTAHAPNTPYSLEPEAIGQRALKNVCLDYLSQRDDSELLALCVQQLQTANNMTDELGALRVLSNRDCPERITALADFYQRWQHEALVVDKWFALQAMAKLPGTLDHIKTLLDHPAFSIKNPNKVRALIGTFSHANPRHFHAANGNGYAFLAEQVMALNELNPQVAARLVSAFNRWRKYDSHRQNLMQAQLQRIAATPALSPDVYEITSKSLAQA